MKNEYLYDTSFLKELDEYNNKFCYVKIIILDMDERPISAIEGRIQSGASINLDGNSAVRRTCNLTFVALEEENDLTDIENLLSINKKISIEKGIKNTFSTKYDNDIFWFPQGIFVITNPSISYSTGGCTISLTCKDKMALLNGECGGNLPASVTFHEYDQILGELEVNTWPNEPNNYTVYNFGTIVTRNGISSQYWIWSAENGWEATDSSIINTVVSCPNLVYDIIQTLVCNYGGESIDKIIINDVPLEIKQLVRNVSSGSLFYNAAAGVYSNDQSLGTDTSGQWIEFKTQEDCGYVYTDFVYPGELISNLGDNICSVLDKIKNTLGNFEYFYDIDGNFVFQEIKNYLNVSYVPASAARTNTPLSYTSSLFGNELSDITLLESNVERRNLIIQVVNNKGILLGREESNFYISYPTTDDKIDKFLLTFVNKDGAWEETNNLFIIDEDNYLVDYNGNKKSIYTFDENNTLITQYSNTPDYSNVKNDFHIWGKDDNDLAIHYHLAIKSKPSIMNTYQVIIENNDLVLDEDGIDYTPTDWRVELYLQGKLKQSLQQRPDMYEQELLDLLPTIYDFTYEDGKIKCEYKDGITNPNTLKYFIDYLEPVNDLYDCSVDLIGGRIYTYQQDNIVKLYNNDVPDVILANIDGDPTYYQKLIKKCQENGNQTFVNVNGVIYSKVAIGTVGYSAQEVARDLLYQYTDYNSSITFQSTPIDYLEPNTRITVNNRKANIYGDYIIKTISRPLDGQGTMSVTATRALERI